VNLFQYRDDLLEFDSGDLSRAAQTVENWFGVPVRFGGLSLLAFGGLELNWSPQSHVLHALSRFFWIFAIAFYENLILFPWIGP